MKKWRCNEIMLPSGQVLQERILIRHNGGAYCVFLVLSLIISLILSFRLFSYGVTKPSLKFILYALYGMTAAVGLAVILCRGIKVIRPNEAAVFTLFGRYHATVIQPGLYFINPFATEEGVIRKHGAYKLGGIVGSYLNGFGSNGHRIPLSPMLCTLKLENILNTQKGYTLSIGVKIEYKIESPARALFAVDDFEEYLCENCETVLRERIRDVLSYGEDEKEKINAAVEQIIRQIEKESMTMIQKVMDSIGCKALSVVFKEIYDKKENQYYTITGGRNYE